MIDICRRLDANPRFHQAILAIIVLTAVLMGLETDAVLAQRFEGLLLVLNAAIQVVFVAELLVRLVAHAPKVHRFFRDGWNTFDFLVVALSLLPAAGPFAMVARLARLLRVGRLLSTLPELRLLVATMLRSIPSMGTIFILLALILYIYAVAGVHLFRDADPEHWGGLGRALMTLFQVLTLEGWVEIMKTGTADRAWVWLYYVSFIVVAVFVVVNLFIAVVINNLEAAKHAHEIASGRQHPAVASLREVREKLAEIERQLQN